MHIAGKRFRGAVAATVAAVLTGSAALAADNWPPPPWGAQARGFAVVQFASDRPGEVEAEWAKLTPGVNIRIVDEIRLGERITTFIAFRGCKADAEGACQVTAELELLDPAGKPALKTSLKVATGVPAPRSDRIHLSRESATVVFGESDTPGDYLVRVAVTDQVAGVTLRTERKFTVRPS